MLFEVRRTSEYEISINNPPFPNASIQDEVRHYTYKDFDAFGNRVVCETDRSVRFWTLEVDNLDALINLVDIAGHELILFKDRATDRHVIEIYDDYRE